MDTLRRARTLLPFLLLLLVAAGSPPFAAEEAAARATPDRSVAITVDDLPVGPPGAHDDAEQADITRRLVRGLREAGVPAVGFVNEDKLEVDGAVDEERVALLEHWLAAGLELGNHTYSHPDLHRVPLDRFQQDVLRGERVTRPLAERHDRPLKWFRHPYLHTGRDLETKRRLEAFLDEHGYRVAPVTIDNSEWIYGGAYARAHAAGNARLKQRLGESYVDYMEQVFAFYEQQSRAIAGEEIPQVLLIHAYLLNADWIDELLAMIESRGYRFVSLEEATRHPAYRSSDEYVGPAGLTWLHRWAITRGMPRDTFAGEPRVPAWVRRAAEGGGY
jgi:peptidoglycan/xylan/chitin deacetylase (PgdA/CDA1 family)